VRRLASPFPRVVLPSPSPFIFLSHFHRFGRSVLCAPRARAPRNDPRAPQTSGLRPAAEERTARRYTSTLPPPSCPPRGVHASRRHRHPRCAILSATTNALGHATQQLPFSINNPFPPTREFEEQYVDSGLEFGECYTYILEFGEKKRKKGTLPEFDQPAYWWETKVDGQWEKTACIPVKPWQQALVEFKGEID